MRTMVLLLAMIGAAASFFFAVAETSLLSMVQGHKKGSGRQLQPKALERWLGDVEWFWQRHTVPEAFTPEAENEHEIGPDNQGCKQYFTCSTWYACLYHGLAGLDFDHEGLTVTPWGVES